MPEWIEAYNLAGVKNEANPSAQKMLRDLSQSFIVCSDLARSLIYAKIIGYPLPNKMDAIFREAELPHIQIPLIRLTPHVWSRIFRLFWLAGISPRVESLESFKQRAVMAVEELIKLAKSHLNIIYRSWYYELVFSQRACYQWLVW